MCVRQTNIRIFLLFISGELVPFLENLVADASVLTILAISFERYYAICRPLQAQYTCTIGRMIKVVVFVWVLTLSVCLPFYWITVYKESNLLDGTPIHVCRSYINEVWKLCFILTRLTAFFICPFIVLSVIYTIISRKLVADSHMMRSASKNANSNMKARRQVVFMLLAVVVVFFACHLPLRTVQVWVIVTDGALKRLGLDGYLNLVYFARCMFYLNSAVNPIVYNMFSSKWRNAFKRALGIMKPKGRGDTTMRTLSTWQSDLKQRDNSEKSTGHSIRRNNNMSECGASGPLLCTVEGSGCAKKHKVHITFQKCSNLNGGMGKNSLCEENLLGGQTSNCSTV